MNLITEWCAIDAPIIHIIIILFYANLFLIQQKQYNLLIKKIKS